MTTVTQGRQKAKHPLLAVVVSAALGGVIVLLYLGFRFSGPLWVLISLMLIGIALLIFLIQALYTSQWAGFKDKKLWDWLNLLGTLAVPVMVAVGTLYFTQQFMQQQNQLADAQHKQDQAIALDQQRADTLQKYMDSIQDLLLNGNLLKSSSNPTNPYYDVEILARARTLTALQGLDPGRKGLLVQFLYDAKLIGFCENCKADATNPILKPAIIDLSSANLSGIHLSGNFGGINFSDNSYPCGSDFCGGDPYCTTFCGANLSGADLSEVSLEAANLSGANLSHVDFTGADLRGANLNGANLSSAYLWGVQNLHQDQLNQVHSCLHATLYRNLKCPKNQ